MANKYIYRRYILDDESYKALKRLAYKQNMSMSAVVRELVKRGEAIMRGKYTVQPDEKED